MQTAFKRHQKVRLLFAPRAEDIEAYEEEYPHIEKGMVGEINMILPNGRYHILIRNEKGEKIAYVVMDEEALEEAAPLPVLDHEDLEQIEDELVKAHHEHHTQ